MPGRILPLITDQAYHIYNRGIDRRSTFTAKPEYQRAKLSLSFYHYKNLPISLSKYLRLEDNKKQSFQETFDKRARLVEVYGYCFMPNHFHLLLRQLEDNGISKYLSNFQNSYTRYFNTRHKRSGPLFMDQFKAVRIENDEQLFHVSRYIHLNPYTGYLIKKPEDLLFYEWSSFPEYVGMKEGGFIEKSFIMSNFHKKEKYKSFVLDQADYQKKLKEIEHLLLE